MVVVKDLQVLAIRCEPNDDPTATITVAPGAINPSRIVPSSVPSIGFPAVRIRY
jgi:hypothetical protein